MKTDKTVPVQQAKPSKGSSGGVTDAQRKEYGRNMAKVVNQFGSKKNG